MTQYAPSTDSEAREMIRGLTLYEDTSDELPQSDLDTQLSIAKMQLKNETGSEDFYSDEGLGQALVATTAILAKAAVENYSITRWDVGSESIDVSGAGDDAQAQFQQWASMAADGVASSSSSSKTQSATNINSANYVG